MTQRLTKREQTLAEGSIIDVARSRNERPEDVLAEADVVVMLDESFSMAAGRKHERAVEALRTLQKTFPGRVVLISFNDSPKFHWNGLPSEPDGSTAIGLALDLAAQFAGLDMRFYLITDGQPTDGITALDVARRAFQQDPINCIFIGSDHDLTGQEFLNHLASLTGGYSAGKVDPSDLSEEVTKMLTGRVDND